MDIQRRENQTERSRWRDRSFCLLNTSAPGAAPCPPRCGPRGRRYRARHPPTQINVLPGIGSARPSTHPAGPPHTVRAVCGAAYPHKGGRRFGHPGGGAVLMLPQGPAGQRTVRLAPPSKKARPSPSGALRPCFFAGAAAALSSRPRYPGPKSGPIWWWPCFGPGVRRPHPVQTGAAA